MLFSCSGGKKTREVNLQTMITQQSDTLTMVYTKNGVKEYRFWTPLMERYEFARDPYMEFRYGINIITFDSLGGDASRLRADYAIFYEKRELWETRGNVVGEGADGRKLFTQQLFWDQKTDKVYSNVDCRIVDGDDEFVGEGFESDSEFKDWLFRESEGRMWVDASQSENPQPKADNNDEAAEDKEMVEEQRQEPKPQNYLEEQERQRRAKQRPSRSQREKQRDRERAEKRDERMQERQMRRTMQDGEGEGLRINQGAQLNPLGGSSN